jgi:hypothetical protein
LWAKTISDFFLNHRVSNSDSGVPEQSGVKLNLAPGGDLFVFDTQAWVEQRFQSRAGQGLFKTVTHRSLSLRHRIAVLHQHCFWRTPIPKLFVTPSSF